MSLRAKVKQLRFQFNSDSLKQILRANTETKSQMFIQVPVNDSKVMFLIFHNEEKYSLKMCFK